MSQEQQPIRSRRELRKARDEALARNRNAAPPGAGESAPASKPSASKGPAANPPASKRPAAPGPGTSAPAGPEKTDSSRASEDNRQDAATGRVRRVAPGPVDSPPAGSAAERSSQIRARDRAALRTIKELAEKEEQLSGGGPPTRRQLRLMQLKEQAITSAMPVVPPADGGAPTGKSPASSAGSPPAAAGKPATATGAKPAGRPSSGQPSGGPGPRPAAPAGDDLPEGMTVEQALEARALLAEQARNQIAKMEHIAATDPEAVDPEILAQQIALAERAAVLNKRAMAKQKLAEQNTPQQGSQNGPSTASNLAMVTPLEFEQVPGVDRPVMKRPATSHVPVVTNPGPRVPARSNRAAKASRTSAPSTGRSRVIARAEAAARSAAAPPASARQHAWTDESGDDVSALPPVSAKSAYGLEPLDAATAGLARANRLRLIQLGVVALGAIALVAGVIMIISGLSR
ncbi:hypothetical protein [Arthrobacter globiformis]|uniref:Uncharacterized protein n=2 Tax=Arthrobacter TaxID=1663 RepID=H0QPG6_ARTG1|nr:hypothetical protein [Arthrobacter globiformis]GAB14717.1 hypothetical protein ARGLB_074_00670 [Arthrobacter globiformis NBRC 12137]